MTIKILGAVIAGGKARRFGADKASASFEGRPLLEHAVETLKFHSTQIVVCGREWGDGISLPDRPHPDMGPLGGLNAALHYARTGGFDGVLSTGCDMPFLPDALVAELTGNGAAVVHGQHLVGYWPASLADALDTHLAASSDRSILAWLAVARPRAVLPPGGPLPNINTQEDLERLRRSRA